jgi:hypothetical protein
MKGRFLVWACGSLLVSGAFAAPTKLSTKWHGAQGDTYRSISRLPDWSGTWAKPDHIRVKGEAPAPEFSPPFKPDYAPALNVRKTKANAEQCLPGGMPGIMGVPLGYEFLFTPGRVTILAEEGPTIRRVYTDGRAHSADPEPTYAGDSIGHWEGDTLVVDTTGIRPKAQFFMGVKTSGQTHVIERIQLVDHDHLQVDTVVEDAVALTMPWHYRWTYVRSTVPFVESYYCDDDRDSNGEPDLQPPPVPAASR